MTKYENNFHGLKTEGNDYLDLGLYREDLPYVYIYI